MWAGRRQNSGVVKGVYIISRLRNKGMIYHITGAEEAPEDAIKPNNRFIQYTMYYLHTM